MMKYLIKIIILFFLININNISAKEKNEILFSIEDNLFTSIDLNKRILYLNILTNSSINFTQQEFINDYVSTLLFNQYAQEKNLKFKENIIDEYYDKIIANLNKDIKYELDLSNIRKNILYDYQRKIILERFLKNKSNDLLEIEDNVLNLYNTTIEYFIIEKEFEKQINLVKNNKEITNSKILNEILNKNNIPNTFFSKKIDDFRNIDEKINKQISNEDSFFYLSEDEYLTLGFINKNLKKNIDLKFKLFQIIIENNDVNIKNIDFKKIEKLSNKNGIIIKKYNKININKLNDYLRKNLKFINDIIKVNDEMNNTYIILCDINYDLDLIKEMTLNEKIDKEVENIENTFINRKKIEYNFVLYNE